MAETNSIANLFDIKDPHIKIEDKVEKKPYKGQIAKVIFGTLSYPFKACPSCGVVNHSTQDMIKHGFVNTTIHLSNIRSQPVLLKLKKQRYHCKHCGATPTVTTSLVDFGCFIAIDNKRYLALELAEEQSMKLISKHLVVSDYTVSCVLKKTGKSLSPHDQSLPEHIGIDEFKSVKSVTESMSCILMDTENGTLMDILRDRKQAAIRDYFMRFSYEARQRVKSITMDMYRPYYQFLKGIFPNAEIIIDRFHLVQHLNCSLNKERVRVMKLIKTSRPTDYRKLKQPWKLILKNREELDFNNYQSHRLFDGLVTEKMIVNYMVSIDDRFEKVYRLINDLKTDIALHNFKHFEKDIEETRKYSLPRQVRTTIQTLQYYLPSIENSLKYTLSNGVLEGTNNKIKNIKRSGYGYRNFDNLRYRILITQKLTVKANKKIRPLLFEEEERAMKDAA